MERLVDLHIHTTASDGSFSSSAALRFAKKIGLSALAIADHDSTEGIDEGIETGKQLGIEVIPAIEISAQNLIRSGYELHLLGYFIDWKNEKLQEHLVRFRKMRKIRAFKIFERLRKVNVHLEPEEIMAAADNGSVGRLHFAKALIAQKFTHNIHDAFSRYLANGKAAYVPKELLSAEDAIRLIIECSGIAVIAHPFYGANENLELIRKLKDIGMKGIEVYHPRHQAKVVRLFEEFADRLGLIKTGGSDCHGEINGNNPHMGILKIPYRILEDLRKLT